MEAARRVRLSAALAAPALVTLLATAGSPIRGVGPSGAEDPPWDPPACPPREAAATGTAAWFRLDAALDRSGWLTGWRLALGTGDGSSRARLDLPPESFASGPVGASILVGDDDGTRSRLRVVDARGRCASEAGRESASVVRGAILARDGSAIFEHRVARDTRADEGVWRRPLGGGTAALVLPGIEPDPAYGPTFVTELRWAQDGRLIVASCGERACRVRVVAPSGGPVARVEAVGPVVGATRTALLAYRPCPGIPCPIESVDLAGGLRRIVVARAGAAALAGRVLVHETPDGTLRSVDLATGASRPLGVAAGLLPVRTGSAATSGISGDTREFVLAPGGRVTGPSGAVRLPASEEVLP